MKQALRWAVWCVALGVLLACASCAGCGESDTGGTAAGGAGGSGGNPPVIPWHEPDYAYRITLIVQAHPTRDRVDLPVVASFDHPGARIVPDVRIHEIVPAGDYPAVAGSAWTQPNGEVFEVAFTAAGTTPMGQTRSFLVYYNVSPDPSPWQWQADAWASFQMLDKDSDGTIDGFRLEAGDYALEREVEPSTSTLIDWRQPGGNSTLTLTPSTWLVADGFSTGYQLETENQSLPAVDLGSVPFAEILSAGTAAWAGTGISWRGQTQPVAHDAFLTYRSFSGWPFMEMVLSAAVADTSKNYRFSSADYTGRALYLADGFDRMVSDSRGDETLGSVWDTSMRWLVVYDSASNRGFGWFVPYANVVRASADAGISIYDSYAGSAGGGRAYRYLWMAGTDKDAIAALFDAMVPGTSVSPSENRDLNIVVPVQDQFFFPEDTLAIAATTPGSALPVSATLRGPDGSEQPVALANSVDPLRWEAVSPVVFDSSTAEGTWTVTAQTALATASVTFEFRLPQHPKLLFAQADLPELIARKDDAAYAGIWQSMLDEAAGYESPIPDPGPGKDIRGYAERLINLGLIQLVDPAQPYSARLWEYFFTMLRYPNWEPDAAVNFNNLDLTVGHFLTALSLVYDWHYDALTPAERAEVRDRLRTVTARWLTTDNMRHYPDIQYQSYGSATGNHYWINHEGVAATSFVLAGEMPEAIRSTWVDHLEVDLATILSVLEHDGTSHEGVAYHSYGQINLFPWLDMRDRALGGNTAQSIPWFAQSVLYDAYSILPGGDDNYGGVANFGDCPPEHYNPPRTINAWLARRLGDGVAQWSATTLDWPYLNPLSYLWFDPTVVATPRTDLPTSHLFPNKGLFAWRSSWNDDATYLSIKSGSYFGGHEHPDAGHFILHRAGVPYVTDHGYSYRKDTAEHNLVVVDGLDVLADPTAMVVSDALTGWQREIVGIGPDMFVVQDVIAGGAPLSVLWLLHSYRSSPPSSIGATYSYTAERLDNPWSGPAAGPWTVTPQDAAPSLHVADLSFGSWSATIAPSFFVPEQIPDGGYNEGLDSYQFGYRLERQASGASLRSTVALWFGETLSAESWSTAAVDGVRLYDGGGDVAQVVWPAGGSATGFHGFDVTGLMAGRRYDELATFGRAVTQLSLVGPGQLVAASAPVDLFARLEHPAPTPQDPRRLLVRADAAAQVTVRCPQQPTAVHDQNGATVSFSWAAGQLTLDVPAGSSRFQLD